MENFIPTEMDGRFPRYNATNNLKEFVSLYTIETMIFTYQELLARYGKQRAITALVKQKKLHRIGRGYYSNTFGSDLAYIRKRYPEAVLTLESAFAYYGLSDTVPSYYHVASLLGSARIKDPLVHQSYQIPKLFSLGVTEMNGIKIYDKERLLLELFRNKKKLPYEEYKSIVLAYRDIKSSLDGVKLARYSEAYSNGAHLLALIREAL